MRHNFKRDVQGDEESLDERKNALNFIYVTPRQLIEKEGSEGKPIKVPELLINVDLACTILCSLYCSN